MACPSRKLISRNSRRWPRWSGASTMACERFQPSSSRADRRLWSRPIANVVRHSESRNVSAAPRHARVGILGGTFDPIHIGHLILAEETRLSLALDRVILVPAGSPWRKSRREISPSADRVAMVAAAIASNPHLE